MKQILVFSGTMLAAGAALIGVALWMMPHAEALNDVSSCMHHYWWLFALWRYCFLSALIWKWPALCEWLGTKHQWDEPTITKASKKRCWVMAVIVLFELVVVYRI
jgi:hypothetical protein